MINIIFYFGVIIIIGIYVGFLIKKFKNDENIDLNRHKWIIAVYILLLILSIFTWRIIYQLLITTTQATIKHNQQIQRIING